MTLELNASDDRRIQTVREEIKNFASTRSVFSSGFKLIVLDEADAMKSEAQFALRQSALSPPIHFFFSDTHTRHCAVIEKYTENVRFCLVCNYVGKIIPAIQSRCTKFRFGPLSDAGIMQMLTAVVAAER